MLTFKKLEYADFQSVSEYFRKDNVKFKVNKMDIICDHAFGTTFIWRWYYNTSYAVVGNTIVLKISTGGTDMFSVPIGGDDVADALIAVKDHAHSEGIPLYFCFVPEDYLPLFRETYDIVFESEEEDWFDYVYDIEFLRNYPGRAYHTQKNHLNKYKKANPDGAYFKITCDNAQALKDYAKLWHFRYSDNSDMAVAEELAIYDMLDNWCDNPHLVGGYITDSNGICGFTIGEIINDTVYVHIEKAEHNTSGAYQFLSSEFLKSISDINVKWVNREEDMGIAGLRKSKMSLRPAKMLKKYTLYCC